MKQTWLRLIVSGGALLVALVHVVWPSLTIDTITAVFVGLAILPWLASLVKSLEVPGIGKIELHAPLPESSKVAALVGEEVSSQVPIGIGTQESSLDGVQTRNKGGRDFNAGVQAGMRAVAAMLEDLTVVVRVDGQEQRREIGQEISRKLTDAAHVLPRYLKADDKPR